MKPKTILLLCLLMTGLGLYAQSTTSVPTNNPNEEIFEILRLKDSIIFKQGFNHCDTGQVRKLLSNSIEFYHDQGGLTTSVPVFLNSVASLCQMEYTATRELDDESLEVHLLRKNGQIYGAIQQGIHRFYGESEDQPKRLTSTANFTHLWIIEGEEWRLKRVLSYNHH